MPRLDPEARRAYQREYYLKNRDQFRESSRKWNAANQDRVRESSRAWKAANPQRVRELHQIQRHGREIIADWPAMWIAQNGLCYLCERPLADDPQSTYVDHDHTCCPQNKSCRACRRGLAHVSCNALIGHAGDDPDLLRRIAGNLERVLGPTRQRIAAKPRQEALIDGPNAAGGALPG